MDEDKTAEVGSQSWVDDRLAEIDRIPDSLQKVKALVELASQLLPSPADVFQEALAAVQEIEEPSAKANASIEIAPHLPESQQQQVLQQALTAAQGIKWPNEKAEVLLKIAPHLTESQQQKVLKRALTVAWAIDEPYLRASMLSAIASHLPESQQRQKIFQQALTVVQTIWTEDSFDEALALGAITSHLPESATELFQQVLTAVQKIEEAFAKAEALSEIAPHLPESLVQQALTAAQGIEDPYFNVMTLSAIAPRLPEPQRQEEFQQALISAQALEMPYFKAKALCAIAPHLPESQQQEVFQQALFAVLSIQEGGHPFSSDVVAKGHALSELASYLPESQQQQVFQQNLTLTRFMALKGQINAAQDTAEALSLIVSRLPESAIDLLQQALAVAQTIEVSQYRAKALSSIVFHLPESAIDLLQQILAAALFIKHSFCIWRIHNLVNEVEHAAAQSFENSFYMGEVLSATVPRLPQSATELLRQALIAAQALENLSAKAKALSAIALCLPESPQHEILCHALKVAQAIEDSSSKANSLRIIVPLLPKFPIDLIQQAFTTAQAIEDSSSKAKALSAIASHLPKSARDLLQQTLTEALAIEKSFYKAKALSAIAPRLSESAQDLLQQALFAAQALENSSAKAEALSVIGSYLPESGKTDTLHQALMITQSLENSYFIADALSAVAPHLSESVPTLLQQARTIAENVENSSAKVKALTAIAPCLPKSQKYEILQQALDIAQVIEISSDKVKALRAILPCLSESESVLLQQACAIAQNIKDEAYRATALTVIASHLPESQRSELLLQALQVTMSIQGLYSTTESLKAIAPQLTPATLKLFTDAALNQAEAAKILASSASRFPEDLLVLLPANRHPVALEIVQHLSSNEDKVKFLSALIPRLPPGRFPAVLKLIETEITDDRFRAETLSNLAPYLPSAQFAEAIRLIETAIKNPHHRTSALEALTPYLDSHPLDAVLDLISTLPLPQLQAKILQAVATTFVTSLANNGSIPLTEPLTSRIVRLTTSLQEPQRSDFSYERAASEIFCQLAPGLSSLPDTTQESANDSSKITQQTVFEAVRQFQDPGYQAAVLIALAPIFPKFVQGCLPTFQGDDYRALLAIKIQLALPADPDLPQEAPIPRLDDQKIQSPFCQVEALVEIACHPAGQARQAEALRAIREISHNSYLQAQFLQRLIPHLQSRQRFEAVNVIGDISDHYHRVSARVALAQMFPESEIFNATLADALNLESRVHKIEQLSQLAIDMPERLPEIIKLAESLHIDQPSETTKDTNNKTETFSIKIERRDILLALAPHLPMRINREVNRELALGRLISRELYDRALFLLARGYRDALQGGTLRNDAAQDRDLLDLKDEINALSGLLLMRDLEPPMAVGILGGWGGGKSYIMHLMQAQMTAIRSRPVHPIEAWNENPNYEKLSPYVGHIYQIKFDAWTFAKSDLWASLMQTIFFELNRQITLEQKLFKFFRDNGIDPYAKNSPYGDIWKVLYQVRDEERDYFLERVLQKSDLENLDPTQQQKIDELLWKKRNVVKQAATEELHKQETALQSVNDRLKQKQEQLEQLETAKTQLKKSQEPEVQELVGQVNQILIVSGVLLRKRIGDDAFRDISQQITSLLPPDLTAESLRKFGGDLRLLISNILEGTDADGKPYNFSCKVFKQWGRKNLALIVIFCGFAAASVVAPLLIAWQLPNAIVPQLVAFIAPLLPAIGMAQKLWRAGQRWYDQAKQALLDCETQIKDSQTVLKRETQRFQKHQEERIATLQAEIEKLTQQAQELEKQVQEAREAVPENVYASLQEFVNDRIKAGNYDKHLGLMHQVKEDLTNLSYRLLPPPAGSQEYLHKLNDLKAVFPRGPARVVVYIDDLDRCPPRRVVQVLEAVQLLVKTPLFIAVLAIDERYITRALEQFYKGVLLRHGSPSGTDYLEKIIQIPYRVRPIMANTLETYLRSQVMLQDSATGGAKFSEFSRQEFNMLLECCRQVDLTPRTIKRLTNVYKLFKIVCRTRGTRPSLQVQQATLALLALSGRYPNLMRGIFEDIQTCFEEQRTRQQAEQMSYSLHLESPLRDFFRNYQLPEGDRYLQREFEKLQHDALQTEILPRNLTLQHMSHEIFNLIRSFSFVGEIGEDPEDYRISGPVVQERDRKNFLNTEPRN